MCLIKGVLLLAITAFGLLGAASASASTALRADLGGALLSGSTTVTNTTSDPATWTLAGTGAVTCSQTFIDANVSRSSSATSIPGTLAAFTFTSCTDTIPVITYSSCALSPVHPLPSVQISASNDTGGTLTINDLTYRCSIMGSTTSFCYFTAGAARGNGNNATSTLWFPSVGVAVVGGSGSLGFACGSSATLSFFLRHIVQGGTSRTVTVTTS
jgi:hypothetical protein